MFITMKKSIIVFIVAILVLATTALWFFTSKVDLKSVDIINFGIIVLVVSFAVFFGVKRFLSSKRGEPAEDELSKKVVRKAAGFSYYISIYMWLAIMYFSDRTDLENHTLIGAGILGMAVIFAICWSVINFTGIRNE